MAVRQTAPTGQGPRGALVFLGLATTLAIIDATIVNVALPSISADIGLSLTAAEWVVSGYGLMLASLLITFGRLADRIGQRRMLIIGVCAFAATSLLCALAPTSAVLIAGRLLQGAAAAAVLPTVQGLINSLYRGPALVTAFAVYGATIGTAAALGPLVGSALVDWFGWPSAFLINLPIAVVVVVGVLRTIPPIPGQERTEGADPFGQLLLFVGLAALVYGLVEAPRAGWFSPTADATLGPIDWGTGAPVSIGFVSLAIGVVVLGSFVLVERARGAAGKPTLVDLSLFQIPSFSAGSLAVLVVALGEFGILFLLPLYLQVGRGLSPLIAQLVVLPTALGSFISAPLTASRKTVPGRTWVMLGLALEVIGLVLLAVAITPDGSVLWMAAPLLVYGTGVGFAISQLTRVTLLEVPIQRVGQASGLSSTARQLGSAVGVAVLTAILSGVLGATLGDRLATSAPEIVEPERTVIAQAIAASPADPGSNAIFATLPPSSLAGVQQATGSSLALGVRIAALAAALPIAGAFFLARRLPVRGPGAQGGVGGPAGPTASDRPDGAPAEQPLSGPGTGPAAAPSTGAPDPGGTRFSET
ncbi:MAG TPA: MFS transporter [Mycobacterium sp.]